jgi:hypothetical protein
MIRIVATTLVLAAGLACNGASAVAFDNEANRNPVEAPRPAVAPTAAPATLNQVPDAADEFKPAGAKSKGLGGGGLGGEALGGNDGWLDDPFRNIGTDMRGIVADLGVSETHVPSTDTQPRVLSRLDVLIAKLEKACKKGGGAAGNRPNRPANASTLGGGPGGIGELRAPGDSRKKWAELTPKEREKILQSQSQGFPAGYEDLLSEYFRRLSQGKKVVPASNDSQPASADAKTGDGAQPAAGADQ